MCMGLAVCVCLQFSIHEYCMCSSLHRSCMYTCILCNVYDMCGGCYGGCLYYAGIVWCMLQYTHVCVL